MRKNLATSASFVFSASRLPALPFAGPCAAAHWPQPAICDMLAGTLCMALIPGGVRAPARNEPAGESSTSENSDDALLLGLPSPVATGAVAGALPRVGGRPAHGRNTPVPDSLLLLGAGSGHGDAVGFT